MFRALPVHEIATAGYPAACLGQASGLAGRGRRELRGRWTALTGVIAANAIIPAAVIAAIAVSGGPSVTLAAALATAAVRNQASMRTSW